MQPVEIPIDALDAGTLRRLVEEYLTREGHEYASVMDVPLAQRVDAVVDRLRRGRAVLTFDPQSQSATVRPA